MADLYEQKPDLPWQFSESTNLYYIWLSATDELLFSNGTRIRRPPQMKAADLKAAEVRANGSSERASGSTSTSEVPRTNKSMISSPPISIASPYQSSSPPNYIVAPSSSYPGSLPNPTIASTNTIVNSPDQTNLTSRMGSLTLSAPPADGPVFSRTGDGNLLAAVRVTKGKGPQIGPLSARVDPEVITAAEVAGGGTERLFPGFKNRTHAFFTVGKVFIMLWSEPAGSTANTGITENERAVVDGPLGEQIHSKIRRFVVIRQAQGYCNALPISTYSRRGVGKPGVNKSEHAIIYTGKTVPKPLLTERAKANENPMRSTAIRVDPDTGEDKLDPLSRLNFGHLHTVQYNVKVKSCGKVAKESLKPLMAVFANVFELPGTQPSASSEASSSRSAIADSAERNQKPSTSTEEKAQEALTSLMDQGLDQPTALKKVGITLLDSGVSNDKVTAILRNIMQ